jgi:hypothetical protein
VPQIEKQQFRNQSGGYIGVVVIGPDGRERGAAVEPDGNVWLSEQEQILTANAPRRPEDNPFIEQAVIRRNIETDAEEEVRLTPLVPINEARFVPANVRPIPSDLAATGAQAAAVAQAAAIAERPSSPSVGEAVEERHADVGAQGESAQPRPTSSIGPVTHTVTPQGTAPPVPRRAAAAAQAAEEEQAVQVNPQIGEETGAARQPTAEPPQGEYAAQEEVGTPDAPAVGGPPTPPAPWSPGSQEQPGTDAEG